MRTRYPDREGVVEHDGFRSPGRPTARATGRCCSSRRGRSSTAESGRRPFLYFPLRNHFEQAFHVPHRLARYGAGTRMDYVQTDPEALATPSPTG